MEVLDFFLKVGPALLAVLLTLGSLVAWGVGSIWRRYKIRNHPLNPVLRKRLASTLSWENCALCPDFCEGVLTHFHFLTEDFGFGLPRIEPNHQIMNYRRGEIGLSIAEDPREQQIIISLARYRTKGSSVVLAGNTLRAREEGLGEGYPAVAEAVKANLADWIEALR